MDGKSGYLAQSSMPAYFGLADAQPQRLQVTWPSGTTQEISEGLKPNAIIDVTEPAN
jgi:hypothetical protein